MSSEGTDVIIFNLPENKLSDFAVYWAKNEMLVTSL
jgi:hypothetical protein